MRQSLLITAIALLLGLGTAARPANAALSTTIKLRWTAPGDDGMDGRAARYDLRMSDRPITAANFLQAASIALFSQPSAAGRPDSVTFNGANPAVTYYFALRTVDEAGNWSGISNVYVRPGIFSLPTSAIENAMIGVTLDFANPWPNPARASVNVAWTLPRSGAVNVEVFDIAGRMVRSLAHGPAGVGRTVLPWNLTDERGRRLGAGIYLIRASLIGETFTRRVVVVP